MLLRATTISVIIGTFFIGMYYVVGATYVQPAQQDRLDQALGMLRPGLTYDLLAQLDEQERYSIIQIAPSDTVALVMEEAKRHPSYLFESKDMIKQLSNSDELKTLKMSQLTALKGFDAKGTALIIKSKDHTFLRLEDIELTSSLDQHIYLTRDGSISAAIDVGKLKASRGSHNYEITGIDFETNYILILYSPTFNTYFAHARFLKE